MARITIYLPDSIEAKARKAAKANGKSISRWIADLVIRRVDDAWPVGVIKASGAIPDFPSTRELRKGYGKDAPRRPLDCFPNTFLQSNS